MSLSYKICTQDDLEVLTNISRGTFVDAFEKHNNPKDFANYIRKAFSSKAIATQLNNPYSSFYFVYFNHELIGYFKLNTQTAQTETVDDGSIELERIYIVSTFQNKGLGYEMLNEIINLAKKEGHKLLWLGVWEENTSAIRFYERKGFRKFSSHPYFVGQDKQTDWLMKLDLL